MPTQDDAESEAYAVLLELKDVPGHPLNKYKGNELIKTIYFRQMADKTLESKTPEISLSIFCANYLDALVDKFLEPPPSPYLNNVLQQELQLYNVYFQMLFLLDQLMLPYWLKYLRSKGATGLKNIEATRVMAQRVLKVVPIWLALGYPIKHPPHWSTDFELGFFSAVPPSSQVLWMLETMVGGIIKEGTTGEILPSGLKTDLQSCLAQWAQYENIHVSIAANGLAETLTEKGIRNDKKRRHGAYGLRDQWHSCGLRSCDVNNADQFKICGSAPELTRKNTGKKGISTAVSKPLGDFLFSSPKAGLCDEV